MKITDKQHELIDAYIQQKLTGSALESFERELAENEVLREEVLFRQGIRSVFQVKAVEQVIQQAKTDPLLEEANERKIEHPQLESVHNTIQQAKTENVIRRKRTIRRLTVMAIAASFLGMFWMSGLWTASEQSLPELADKNFSTPKVELNYTTPEIESVSATQAGIEALLSEAMEAYDAQEFDKTLAIFDNLRSEYSYETDEMLLYEGIIDYHKNNYGRAADLLQQITTRNSKIKNEAHWYLALTYLKNNEKDLAKEQLEIVIKQSTTHQKDAKSLLKVL